MQKRRTVLKLGSNCNLKCKHCHCMPSHPVFNHDVVNYLIDNQFTDIYIGGGEPFLYFDLIKDIVNELPDFIKYYTVTNGTVLTQEIVDFCNEYKIEVGFSYDGDDGSRDGVGLIQYNLLNQIQKLTISSVISHDNTDIEQIIKNLRRDARNMGLDKYADVDYLYPAFLHQTTYSPNIGTTKDDARQYITQIGHSLQFGALDYIQHNETNNLYVLFYFVRHFCNHPLYQTGCRCCHPNNYAIRIDGKILLCPYGDKIVGDIYQGVDWNLVESYIPDRCKTCDLFPICGNTCVANITDNECYIFRCLYRHYKKLLKKYHIDEEELLNRPEWKEE